MVLAAGGSQWLAAGHRGLPPSAIRDRSAFMELAIQRIDTSEPAAAAAIDALAP